MVLKKYQVQYPVENPPKVNRTVPYHAVEKRHYFQCRCGEGGDAGGVNGCVERGLGQVWGVLPNLW